jgi:aryl-alcohol dehydrogenase-like predicted oxidoreductase
MLSGKATAKGMSAGQAPALRQETTRLGGLPVGTLGWGTQSGEVKNIVDSKFERALPAVLDAGIRIVDSSPSYRCRRSMKAIGNALKSQVAQGHVSREELLLISHVGWLAFDRKEENPALFLDREIKRLGLQLADFVGGVWSLHPAWIRDQVELARTLAGIEHIELLMLDAPELGRRVWSVEEWRVRLTEAFATCEELAAEGLIGHYGLCSMDGFRPPEKQVLALDPLELASLAKQAAGGESRLAAVQMPFNLAMLESLNAKNRGGAGLFDLLEELGWWRIGCLPLGQGQLCHSIPSALKPLMAGLSPAQASLEFARSAPMLDTVLVGMKTREHLEENLELAKRKALKKDDWLSLFVEESS